MIDILRISGILLCLFTTPVWAQEGHFGVKAEAKTEAAETLMPDAGSDFSELRSQGTVIIDQVIDPLRMRLQDGRIIQLSGLDIPDNDPANPGEVSNKAFDLLKSLLEKKQATLYQTRTEGEGRKNRMGHYLGHLETHQGKFWVQGTLLLNGLARIQPGPVHTEMAAQMLALESKAIQERRGLWDLPEFGMLTPETAESAMNSWAIVEGTISKTGMSNNIIFLNFGDDWRKDFTIGIEGAVRRQMSKQNIDTLGLGGKRVRVHGWMESYNGPYIKLSHALWLEILPDAAVRDNLPAED